MENPQYGVTTNPANTIRWLEKIKQYVLKASKRLQNKELLLTKAK